MAKRWYSADVRFSTLVPGVGGGLTTYAGSLQELMGRVDTIELQDPAVKLHVVIRKNTGVFPVFAWVEIDRFTREGLVL